jgi:hypothetical protein
LAGTNVSVENVASAFRAEEAAGISKALLPIYQTM